MSVGGCILRFLMLNKPTFFRVFKTILVNVDHIETITRTGPGEVSIGTASGKVFQLDKDQSRELQSLLQFPEINRDRATKPLKRASGGGSRP